MTGVLCVAAVLVTFMGGTNVAKAAGGTTYYVAYVPALGGYRFYDQQWNGENNVNHLHITSLNDTLKDGDSLVLHNSSAMRFEVSLDKKLNEFTIVGDNTGAVIHAKSFEKVIVCKNTTVAVNGDVKEAFVYDNAVCNFNNNVGILHGIEDTEKAYNVAVVGTVDCFSESKTGVEGTNDYYAYQKGACILRNGGMYALDGTYSRDPGAVKNPMGSNDKTPATGSDLDEVPKTGDNSTSVGIYLILMSFVCAAGCMVLGKKKA